MEQSAKTSDFAGFRDICVDEITVHWDRLLGMGLYFAWLQLVFSSPVVSAYTENPVFAFPLSGEVHNSVYTQSLFVTVLLFLIIALAAKKIHTIAGNKILFWGSHLGICLGALCLVVPATASSPFLFVLAIVLIGACSAGVFIAWGEHLASLPPRRVLFDVGVLSLLTALFFAIVINTPVTVFQVSVVLIPLVSGLLLYRSLKTAGAVVSSPTTSTPFARMWIGLLALACVVGLAYGLMRGITLTYAEHSTDIATIAIVIGIACTGVLLLVVNMIFRREEQLYLVCQIALPLIAAGFLLLPQFGTGFPFPLIILTVGHSFFYSLLWVFCVDLARHTNIIPIRIFSLGLFTFFSGMLIGALASDLLSKIAPLTSQAITAISFVVIYITALILAIVLGAKRKAERYSAQPALNTEIQSCCNELSKEKGLTARENEILFLLAAGRDRAFIRESLYISTDTIKSHIRHIYMKLDVHSKAEMLTLIDILFEKKQRGM